MKLLILGGTQFVGRHIAELALQHGHELTLLTRGLTNPNLFEGNPAVELLRGDRSTPDGLSALGDSSRRWDAVIDVNGYFPRDVLATAKLLAERVERYLFISTISVYRDFSRKYMAEDSPIATLENPESQTEINGANYGALKALCEQEVSNIYGEDRATIVRPGLVVGPYDYTNRFAYWPMRLVRGGETLAPGAPERAVQFIDARDLAAFTLRLLEQQERGTYNAAGPTRQPLGMREFLDTCRATLGGDATFTWVSDWLLKDYGVAPYTELPLWIPEDANTLGSGFLNCRHASTAGLTYRPIAQTIADTYNWLLTIHQSFPPGASLTSEREHTILRGWHRLSHPYRGD